MGVTVNSIIDIIAPPLLYTQKIEKVLYCVVLYGETMSVRVEMYCYYALT